MLLQGGTRFPIQIWWRKTMTVRIVSGSATLADPEGAVFSHITTDNTGSKDRSQAIAISDTQASSGREICLHVDPEKANGTPVAVQLDLEVPGLRQHRALLNGYQSWSECFEVDLTSRVRRVNPLFARYMGQCSDYELARQLRISCSTYSWSYTALKANDGHNLLLASLDESSGYTAFEYRPERNAILVKKECGQRSPDGPLSSIRILIVEGTEDECFQRLRQALGIAYERPKVPETAWTSWYNYYSDISEEILLANLKALKERHIPLTYFQIDDGYQSALGDWLIPNARFPKGMKHLAEMIREFGFVPGLWISPFICEKDSQLFREHPDWVARDDRGRPILAGRNRAWGGPYFVLDLHDDAVRSHIRDTVAAIAFDWGYELLKADYLYAPGLCARPGETQAQLHTEAIALLREGLGDRKLLACGAPLWPTVGKADYCRIGNDVGIKWEKPLAVALGFRERVSTKSCISNTLLRWPLGNLLGADPDVFILRQNGHSLSAAQKYALLLVNALFGDLLSTSDDISTYSDEEMRDLLSLFPLVRPQIRSATPTNGIYLIEVAIKDRHYLVGVNMSPARREIPTLAQPHFEGRSQEMHPAGTAVALEPWESKCLLRVDSSEYQLLGGANHLFSGCEAIAFSVADRSVALQVDPANRNSGPVLVRVPESCQAIQINGEQCRTFRLGPVTVATWTRAQLTQ